ncbi:glutathione hydrolase 1 proenzyme-like [Chironomus tepperi]|uniref:glutathione hydrolase 1 proenzyme-like n=1 Tax=Chironomus tepperi TaxID=113505 RepID=UPI00391F2167
MKKATDRLFRIILVLLAAAIVSGFIVFLSIYLVTRDSDATTTQSPIIPTTTLPPSITTTTDNPQIQQKSAIVTNGLECAAIGRKIFELGGNVADVAVSVVLCEGITCPQSSGIGGGFFLTFYSKANGTVKTLNARERAPAAATEDMFIENSLESQSGGKSVAVPGEIKGLWELHQNYGSLKWKDLLQPVIELCREGHEVSKYLENIFRNNEAKIYGEPSLRDVYINPMTNHTYRLGEKIKRLKLAETLEVIAEEGADSIYGGGSIGAKMVEDVQKRNGILTVEDLMNYEVEWSTSVSTKIINNYTLHTFPLPSSGPCLVFIFNLLREYELKHDALTYHRIVEAFKFAYAKRTHLGDDHTDEIKQMIDNLTNQAYADEIRKLINDTSTTNNVQYYGPLYSDVENHGTANVGILAPNGDAIGVTNSINYLLGAFFRSEQTGIIMNNHMDDFSTPGAPNIYGIPPSPANFIKPGKFPLSSMIPTLVIDGNGDVKMIVGAAGGSRIPTGVFSAIFNHLYLKGSLESSLDARRLHHQLTPLDLQFESNFDPDIMKLLNEQYGHTLRENFPDGGFAAVTAISQENGDTVASYDSRRGGGIEVF